MHLRKFDSGYSRRHFLTQAAQGVFSAGVLMPTWQAIAADGDVSKAYPDELLSIEGYTKGRIKTGDDIHAGNVELVKDLLEPIRFEQVLKQGRRLTVARTTTDVMRTSKRRCAMPDGRVSTPAAASSTMTANRGSEAIRFPIRNRASSCLPPRP
jgi:hypothetical protein